MKTGIEIRNLYKNIIINGFYKNLVLSRKLRVSDMENAGNKPIYTNQWSFYKESVKPSTGYVKAFSFAPTSDELFIAIGPQPYLLENIVVFKLQQDSENYDPKIYIASTKNTNISDIYVYTFKLADGCVGKQGLQVFNEDGACVYDSNQKYMDVWFDSDSGVFEYTGDSYDVAIGIHIVDGIKTTSNGQEWVFPHIQTCFFRIGSTLYAKCDTAEGLTLSSMHNIFYPTLLIFTNNLNQ